MRNFILLVTLVPTFANAQLNAVDPSTAAVTAYRESTKNTSTATPTTFGNNSSINPAAQQGQQSQSGGSGANMAAGAALLAACMMTMPPNIALCAMGALAMAQGGHDKDAAKQSANTAAATSNSGATGTNATTYTDPGKGAGAYSDQVKAGLQSLDDAGIKVSESGVTMPDGSKVSASGMGNSAAMTAAGFDAKQVADAKKVTDALNAEMKNGAHVSGMAVAESGGGGSGSASESPANEKEGVTLPPGFDPFGTANSAAARSRAIAGKTVNFDGEPIGVRGNNIFEMVHNCYQRKRSGNHFIENEASTVVRAPASVGPGASSGVRATAVRKK